VYAGGSTFRASDWLTLDALRDHYAGCGPRVGLYVHHPVTRLGRLTVIDIDAHNGERPENWPVALAAAAEAWSWGVLPVVEHSNGQCGYKVWLLWDRWLDIPTLRAAGEHLMRSHPGHEIFPKQWRPSRFGHYVRLPGPHHKRPWWSQFYDVRTGEWYAGEVAPRWLANHGPQSAARIPAEVIARRDRAMADAEGSVARRVEARQSREQFLTLRRQFGRPTDERVGEMFDASVGWTDILGPHGWTPQPGGRQGYWTRPGKGSGVSACVLDGDRLYVHSTAAAPLEAGRTYTKFAAWACLEFAGDFRSAAREATKRHGDRE
jgi:hypothetical protein